MEYAEVSIFRESFSLVGVGAKQIIKLRQKIKSRINIVEMLQGRLRL